MKSETRSLGDSLLYSINDQWDNEWAKKNGTKKYTKKKAKMADTSDLSGVHGARGSGFVWFNEQVVD